ncbi:hypothetical protein Goshw_001848 [Gossypium schwendimanii]|uniref:DUF7745 domain-containing protein n=1 Tax=Gossypium schwendimanii TaxID=34291 RepID=A0A7J9NAU5_GOSSC|nr:hypothetical protein [Gossypium schwendimanii]
MQQKKGDSLTEGYVSELWDFTRFSVTQNSLQDLKEIWGQWDNEIKQLFYRHYGDLPYLLDIKVDEHLFQALAQFLNLVYSCFTFGKVDLVPIVEEYTTLLRCPKIQIDKVYSRAANVLTFLKKLMGITGMTHLDMKKRVDIFSLSIYGLVVFSKALGYIDEAVSDLFNRLDKGVTPVPLLLEDRKGLLSSFLRELFSIKGISGYTEVRRHFKRKVDSNSPESPRGGCRMESSLDDT